MTSSIGSGVFITRVEGEGKVLLYTDGETVKDVEIAVSEAPRFFEYIVRGRDIDLVPDIVSRICGLCGVSYAFVASKAFERCLGIDVPDEVEEFRRVLHLAERIKSHVIHIFFLNLSDFLNAESAFEISSRNPNLFRNATKVLLWARKAMEILGGRFHNVVNIRIGGIFKYPDRVEELRRSFNDVYRVFLELAEAVLSLETIPSNPMDLELATVLNQAQGYPHLGYKIAFHRAGKILDVEDFEKHVEVLQKPRSNALHYRFQGRSYVVGPIARFNTHYTYLEPEAREFIEQFGWKAPLKNIYQNIVARIAEVIDSFIKLDKFLNSYRPVEFKTPPIPRIENKSELICTAAIEAPRGILYHRYRISPERRVLDCNIITPTAQNMASMEDLSRISVCGKRVEENIAINTVEKIIRAYDPCISCSVHIIKL